MAMRLIPSLTLWHALEQYIQFHIVAVHLPANWMGFNKYAERKPCDGLKRTFHLRGIIVFSAASCHWNQCKLWLNELWEDFNSNNQQ